MHTPGPWFAADWSNDFGSNKVTIEARVPDDVRPGETSWWPDGIKKLCIASTEDGVNPIEDAKLIAAAPEMYDALCDLCESGGPDDGSDVMIKAKAALAKARGEAA